MLIVPVSDGVLDPGGGNAGYVVASSCRRFLVGR